MINWFPSNLLLNPYILYGVLSIIFLLLIFVLYYLMTAVKRPKLYCAKESLFGSFLLEHLPALKERYWPTPWCLHSHLMTPFSSFFRLRQPELPFSREIIPTPDGGQFSLDWYIPELPVVKSSILTIDSPPKPHPQPIALFLCGLTGCSRAEYLRHLVPGAFQAGYRPVVMNCRGLGGLPLTSSWLYCAAKYQDLGKALAHIKHQNPGARIVATGLSLGGIILGGYLVAHGSQTLVDAACLISACYDFNKGNHQLDSGPLNRAVNHALTRSLRKIVVSHRHVYAEAGYNWDRIDRARKLVTIDEEFTIKMFGYKTTEHLYQEASLAGKLIRLQVPTLAIQAADDMLAPESDLPLDEVCQSTHLAMLVTARGGHIGFMEGMASLKPSFYLERVFHQYLKALNNKPLPKLYYLSS